MIFIRVDGANIQKIGMGHLYRMIFLADQLHKKTGISPLFVIAGYLETIDALTRNNFKYVEINKKNETNEILKLNQRSQKDTLIIDTCDNDGEHIAKLTDKYTVISFDDTKGGVKQSDIVINSVVEGTFERKNFYYGTEYFLIRPEIGKYNLKKKIISNSVENILISLGGSDPCSLNLKMIDWLKGLRYSGKINWVLGPSVSDKDMIVERFKDLNLDITPIIDYKDMGKLYFDADLCISAAGFSLYEIACVGLPAITICLYPQQIPTAKKFEEKETICNLGYYKDIPEDNLKNVLYKLLSDQPLRASMSRKGKAFVDGLGMERVMDKLMNFINLNRRV